jgi:hypothetical protein
MLGIRHEIVKRILRDDLNMRKVNFKEVPHALDSSQNTVRAHISRGLLDFLESRIDRSLSNVYTRNEMWVYLDNPRTSMLIGTNVTRSNRVRRTVTSRKCLFWIDFSEIGIGAVIMMPAGQSFNKDFFAGTMLRSIDDNRALSPPKLKASGTFLHLRNARSHLTSDKYGIKRLPHPPYSSDLALCDLWLFDILSIVLRDRSSMMTSHWKERCRKF